VFAHSIGSTVMGEASALRTIRLWPKFALAYSFQTRASDSMCQRSVRPGSWTSTLDS
jgi:hypothetical protein